MVSVTDVALVVTPGLTMQVASLGSPVQLYVTGTAVVELEPLVTMNPVELVTVRFTGPEVAPWETVSVPPLRLDEIEKV
jgi:hypothetical protein